MPKFLYKQTSEYSINKEQILHNQRITNIQSTELQGKKQAHPILNIIILEKGYAKPDANQSVSLHRAPAAIDKKYQKSIPPEKKQSGKSTKQQMS